VHYSADIGSPGDNRVAIKTGGDWLHEPLAAISMVHLLLSNGNI
jgi:hypothetical protein